jgi:hypothetical protein
MRGMVRSIRGLRGIDYTSGQPAFIQAERKARFAPAEYLGVDDVSREVARHKNADEIRGESTSLHVGASRGQPKAKVERNMRQGELPASERRCTGRTAAKQELRSVAGSPDSSVTRSSSKSKVPWCHSQFCLEHSRKVTLAGESY